MTVPTVPIIFIQHFLNFWYFLCFGGLMLKNIRKIGQFPYQSCAAIDIFDFTKFHKMKVTVPVVLVQKFAQLEI
jgi:hypothetical protein